MRKDTATKKTALQQGKKVHKYEDKHYPKSNIRNGDTSKRWYIEYYVFDENKGDYVRKLEFSMNKIKEKKEREVFCKNRMKELTRYLAMGYTIEKTEVIIEPPKKLSVLDLLKEFIRLKEQRNRPNSMKGLNTVKNELGRWFYALGKTDILLSEFDAKAFLLYTKAKGNKAKTYNNNLADLKQFLKWCEKQEVGYVSTISEEQKYPEIDTEGAIPYSREQIEKIKKHLQEKEDKQLLLFITFVYYTLARPETEIMKMRVKDIGKADIFISAANSKSKRIRHVGIPNGFNKVLEQENIRSYPPHYFIFGSEGVPSVTQASYKEQIYKRHCKMLKELKLWGLGYKLYGYKHTGACALYEATKNLLLVRDQCGHRHSNTTEIYLRNMGLLIDPRIIDDFPDF